MEMLALDVPGLAAIGIGVGPDIIGLAQHMQPEDIGMIGRAAGLGVADDALSGQDGAGISHLHAIGHAFDPLIGEQDHLMPIVQKGLQAELFEPAELSAHPK